GSGPSRIEARTSARETGHGRNSGMVGRLEAGGRVAAAALLALGSLAPLEGPLVAVPPAVASVADASTACAMTVGTASTDPAFAADAARALAVGYATTD